MVVNNRFYVILLSIMVVSWGNNSDLVESRELNLLGIRLPGGSHDSKGFENTGEIENLARFAVQEHNKKQNDVLEFVRVLKSKEQVVAGKLYYLTLEAIEAGHKKLYEVKVWVKPWMNFKQLKEFKYAEASTTSDLGGGLAVPANDPEVQDAANHAVKSIHQKSNSLSPYELLEIILAKAKVIEDYAKFELLLNVRRGIKEENVGVEVI
ncbi:cysteine protease inhibitor, putative [Ricinus communis]|uniref:Cysteine proteinase inhibitor n=1 Tax=Ricinus communis TaxID=3988 RepID=B9SJN2_RICCO|nr:cysteine protease inhibitor, putative [Ricinus communis]